MRINRERCDLGRFLKRVLDKPNCTNELRARGFNDDLRCVENHFAHRNPQRLLVYCRGAGLLAKSDHQHFGDPAFDYFGETGMRLDAVNGYNPVSVVAVFVLKHGKPGRGGSDLNGVHTRKDWAADTLLGNTVSVGEN